MGGSPLIEPLDIANTSAPSPSPTPGVSSFEDDTVDASSSIWKALRLGFTVLAIAAMPRGAKIVARLVVVYASPKLFALFRTASYVASRCSVAY